MFPELYDSIVKKLPLPVVKLAKTLPALFPVTIAPLTSNLVVGLVVPIPTLPYIPVLVANISIVPPPLVPVPPLAIILLSKSMTFLPV